MMPEKNILVKIQQSSDTGNKKSVLVYDKSRVLFFSSDDPGIVIPLSGKLGNRKSAYFLARIAGNELKIGSEIENQDW